jgi:hypothetical protein
MYNTVADTVFLNISESLVMAYVSLYKNKKFC